MTTAEAVGLYRAEKAAYLARTADERAAAMERVRARLVGEDGGLKPMTVSEKGAKIAAARLAKARASAHKKAQGNAYYYRRKKAKPA